MMKKRMLSALLALFILSIPLTSFADETDSPLSIKGGNDITSTEQSTLKAEGGSSESGYQWYRNGDVLDGANDSTLTTDRSGDYHVSQGGSQSSTVRVVRDFDTRGSSGILIGRRSNTLAKRKDSQIEKLESRVAQAAADAAQPPEAVSLGMIYSAVDSASSSGGVVTLCDAGMLEPENRGVLVRRIGEAGLPDRLYADRISDYKVTTRLSLTPSRISSAVDLGLFLGDEALTSQFESVFSNRLLVIDAAQEGSYGQTVEMMIRGDALSGATNLSFYRYDPETNRCDTVAVSGVHFDATGYLHFKISSGGLLIVSEGDLAARN